MSFRFTPTCVAMAGPLSSQFLGPYATLDVEKSSCTWKAAQTTFQTISHANLRSAFLYCKFFDSMAANFYNYLTYIAVWFFFFSNYGKSFAGRFKHFHAGKVYCDVRLILIKKVPHRIKPFPASTNRSMTSSSGWSCALLTALQEASQVCATILSRTFSLVGCDTDHRAVQIDGTCPRSLLSDSTNIVPGGPVTHLSNVGFSLILW